MYPLSKFYRKDINLSKLGKASRREHKIPRAQEDNNGHIKKTTSRWTGRIRSTWRITVRKVHAFRRWRANDRTLRWANLSGLLLEIGNSPVVKELFYVITELFWLINHLRELDMVYSARLSRSTHLIRIPTFFGIIFSSGSGDGSGRPHQPPSPLLYHEIFF